MKILYRIGLIICSICFVSINLFAEKNKEKEEKKKQKNSEIQKDKEQDSKENPWYFQINSDSIKAERPKELPKK